MKIGLIVALLLGIACAIGVVGYFGAGAVFRAAAAVGWGGFALLCASALLLYPVLGAAWRALAAGEAQTRLTGFMWGRLIRDAATELLPFSSIGGFVLGARAAMHSGFSASAAFSSSLVDLTTELFAQIAFILFGAGAWMLRLNHSAAERGLAPALAAGLAVFVIGGLGFFAFQRGGLRWASQKLARFAPGVEQNTADFHEKLERIYEDRTALFWSSALHLVGWFGSALIAWLAFRLIGSDCDFLSVVSIEALICALRSIAFIVPSALGVQEAGYALIAPLFGVPAEAGVAVSLLKRAREIATGVIALAAWQARESQQLLHSAPGRDRAGGP